MKLPRCVRGTEGAAGVITGLFLTVAAGAMSVAIDLGHIFLVRCELQRAADAGAMAAARGLVTISPGKTGVTITPNCANALTLGQQVVAANTADGGTLTLPSADVIFGTWNMATKTFQAIGCGNPDQVTAVKVVTRKDKTANGPVPMSFIRMLPGGMTEKELTAEAVGLTGYPGGAPRGAGTFPIAVDVDKIPPYNTPFRIHLSPNNQDDGCWHSYNYQNTNANDLRAFVDGTKETPPISVGDNIYVQNGVDASVLQDVAGQLASRTAQGQPYDVLVPIIPTDAHTTSAEVLGFATLEITDVVSQGDDKYVEGHIVPNYTTALDPGGTLNSGTWVIPKMVL